jgi:hypothetical protein
MTPDEVDSRRERIASARLRGEEIGQRLVRLASHTATFADDATRSGQAASSAANAAAMAYQRAGVAHVSSAQRHRAFADYLDRQGDEARATEHRAAALADDAAADYDMRQAAGDVGSEPEF